METRLHFNTVDSISSIVIVDDVSELARLQKERDLYRRLLDRGINQTYYQYGYLRNADTLCFWNRELLQVGAILGNTTETPPNCLF